jgi:hypothetical protein
MTNDALVVNRRREGSKPDVLKIAMRLARRLRRENQLFECVYAVHIREGRQAEGEAHKEKREYNAREW